MCFILLLAKKLKARILFEYYLVSLGSLPKGTRTSSVAVLLTRAGQANNTESKEKKHFV